MSRKNFMLESTSIKKLKTFVMVGKPSMALKCSKVAHKIYKPFKTDVLLSGTDCFLFTPTTLRPIDGLLYPMGLTCKVEGLPDDIQPLYKIRYKIVKKNMCFHMCFLSLKLIVQSLPPPPTHTHTPFLSKYLVRLQE